MADNVAITAGAGTVVHADEYTHTVLGSGKTQLVKIVDGVLDSETPLKVAAEDVASAGGEGGILAMGIRKDVPAALGQDLDFTYSQFDKYGKQWVSGAYPEDLASTDLDPIMVVGGRRTATPANQSGTDGDYEPLQMNNGALWTAPLCFPVTVQTDVTRVADTLVYAAGDCWSDHVTTPVAGAGGYTFTGAARKSGGSGVIIDATFATSNDPATRLSGEIFIFNTSATNPGDNTAYVVSDAEIKTCVGVIPFSMFDAGNNGFCHLPGLNMMFTCSGSANLRFHVRVRNAYTPASAEVLTCTLKILQLD